MKQHAPISITAIGALIVFLAVEMPAQQDKFDSLHMGMGNLYRVSSAKTRSISPENFTGEKGRGGMATEGTGKSASRELGQKWKVSPSVRIESKQTFTLASIQGPGAVQHIWMTPTGVWRFSIIRFYWDGEETPSIECPVGDFFAMGWGKYAQINSLAVAVNPGSAFNTYWVMPFRKSCRITMENIDDKPMTLYYQITYALTDIPPDGAYLHTQFRRSNPLPWKQDHVLLDGVRGQGQYVGTYIAYGSHNSGWWGEGEIKFFIDGDTEFPTICGTGTEDYFCGSYDFDNPETKRYQEFSGPYSGLAQVLRADGQYQSQQRFGMYRWHIMDPIRFEKDLKITIQALGWKSGGRYLPLQDDIASTVFWYQQEPHAAFPKLPAKDALEIN
ncbi:MAG TPA: glycoside hydrolase family 172 protein [Acidobacteriota bacterium]|nr:glycoside hydrolase family 172 protein [Acidobacteriota bacterium]